MRKRLGAREVAAAVLIIGVAVVYWSRPAAPPVTIAQPATETAAP
ncbi:MAG: hypothetical protein AAFR96_08665 [Planctomycetota bacterium]